MLQIIEFHLRPWIPYFFQFNWIVSYWLGMLTGINNSAVFVLSLFHFLVICFSLFACYSPFVFCLLYCVICFLFDFVFAIAIFDYYEFFYVCVCVCVCVSKKPFICFRAFYFVFAFVFCIFPFDLFILLFLVLFLFCFFHCCFYSYCFALSLAFKARAIVRFFLIIILHFILNVTCQT